MSLEIKIDREKCKVPLECRKCLEICPQCVFKLHPTQIKKFVEILPEHWELHVSFPDLCAGCMECVMICPKKAIKIKPLKADERQEIHMGGKC